MPAFSAKVVEGTVRWAKSITLGREDIAYKNKGLSAEGVPHLFRVQEVEGILFIDHDSGGLRRKEHVLRRGRCAQEGYGAAGVCLEGRRDDRPLPRQTLKRQKFRRAFRLSSRSLIPEPKRTAMRSAFPISVPAFSRTAPSTPPGAAAFAASLPLSDFLNSAKPSRPSACFDVRSVFQHPLRESIEHKGVLTRQGLQMGIGDSCERRWEGIDDDHPGAFMNDGLPHPVGQEMIVDQKIRAGNDDQVTAGEPLPAVETDPPFLKGGGHFPRMVEGRGSDPGPFEETGDLGKEIQLLVGHTGGDEKSDTLAFRGKALEPIRRRLHGSFPFHRLSLCHRPSNRVCISRDG